MFDRMKQGLDLRHGAEKTSDDGLIAQLRDVGSGDERWAEVIEIGGKKRGWTRLQLEIHHEGRVYPNESYTQIPKGATLAVGDHVAIVTVLQATRSEMTVRGLVPAPIAKNGALTSWKIHWGKEPQYGRLAPAQAELTETYAGDRLANLPDPAAEVERLQAAGTLSAAEAEQTTAYLAGTASVEDLHASGAMSDAHFAQAQRVRQEALDRFAALRDAGTLTEEQYQAAIASLGG